MYLHRPHAILVLIATICTAVVGLTGCRSGRLSSLPGVNWLSSWRGDSPPDSSLASKPSSSAIPAPAQVDSNQAVASGPGVNGYGGPQYPTTNPGMAYPAAPAGGYNTGPYATGPVGVGDGSSPPANSWETTMPPTGTQPPNQFYASQPPAGSSTRHPLYTAAARGVEPVYGGAADPYAARPVTGVNATAGNAYPTTPPAGSGPPPAVGPYAAPGYGSSYGGNPTSPGAAGYVDPAAYNTNPTPTYPPTHPPRAAGQYVPTAQPAAIGYEPPAQNPSYSGQPAVGPPSTLQPTTGPVDQKPATAPAWRPGSTSDYPAPGYSQPPVGGGFPKGPAQNYMPGPPQAGIPGATGGGTYSQQAPATSRPPSDYGQ